MWALTFVVIRDALDAGVIDPAWMIAGRTTIGALVLAPLLLGGPRLGARGWRIAAVVGLLNVVLFTGFQIIGLATVGAGPAAAIIYVQPVLVALGARIFLDESLGARRAVGILLGLAGVAVVGLHEITAVAPWATAGLFVGALAWAAGTLVTRATPELPVLALVAAEHVLAAPVLLAVAVAVEPFPAPSWHAAWAVGFAGALGSGFGWVAFTTLLRRGEAGAVAAWLFSVPIVAAVFGVVLLGEPLHVALVAGLVLVCVGVRLAVGGRQPEA